MSSASAPNPALNIRTRSADSLLTMVVPRPVPQRRHGGAAGEMRVSPGVDLVQVGRAVDRVAVAPGVSPKRQPSSVSAGSTMATDTTSSSLFSLRAMRTRVAQGQTSAA